MTNKRVDVMMAASLGVALSAGMNTFQMFGGQPYASDWKSDPERLAKVEEKRKRKQLKNKGVNT